MESLDQAVVREILAAEFCDEAQFALCDVVLDVDWHFLHSCAALASYFSLDPDLVRNLMIQHLSCASHAVCDVVERDVRDARPQSFQVLYGLPHLWAHQGKVQREFLGSVEIAGHPRHLLEL